MIEDDNRNQNPQDGSVGVERRPNNRRTLMAKASLFEQQPNQHAQQQQQPTIGTGKMKRKVMPKSRRTSMPPSSAAPAAHHPPEPTTNRDKAPVSPSKPGRPKARASPRRQTIASTTSTTNTNRAQLLNQLALLEDGAESLSSTEAETDSQDLLVQSTMAQIAPPPHKLSPAIKRASILQQFQKQRLEEMKKKREEEAHRLERIKQGRRIQNIRSSVDNYDKTIEKNKQYGFDKGCSPKKKAPPKRRITDVEAAKAAEAMEHHDITETEVELDEDEQSITLDQILPKNIHKTTPTRPQRHESKESTLSPIRVPRKAKPTDDKEDDDVPDDTSSIATEDLPVPKIINVVESSSMDDSEISLSSSIRPKSRRSMLVKEESSRWEAEPAPPCQKKKMSTSMLDQDPVVWNPVPALLKAPATEPNSRWAVHPRVVYGKPKTEKAVQPPPGRWAATGAPARKKKVFPRNESRWAAQPKKKAQQQLPENGSRLPRRQATKDGTNGPLLPCNKPRRQATKEDLPTKQQRQQAQAQAQAHAPRRGRRRQSMMDPQPAGATTVVTAPAATTTTTTKEIQEAPATTTTTTTTAAAVATTAKEETTKAKLLSRTLSLGEVKKIHAATRIQATLRMYKERYQYKMMRQQQRKEEIQTETQQELQEIRDNRMKRQESLRARMERDAQAGVILSDSGGSSSNGSMADASSLPSDEKELKRQIAELEKSNAKLQSQCDRLRGSNSRMQSGNKTREAALKEVNGRLSKLQHIQKKLNKVKQEFQNEYSTIEQELKDTNAKLQTEVALQEATKACFRQIVVRMRANQSDLSKGFADLTLDVEDMVPIDCLP